MSNDFLYPADPNAKEFFQYFCHYWDFITAPVGTKDWQTVKNYKLQPRVLWRRFQDSQKLLGVRFGQYTTYGMIDLDRSSLLHFINNPQAFNDLCDAFELIGLCRFVILFSSWTDGVHIYFPLPDEVNTFDLACALRMAVEGAGFKVKGGQLELFPNTKPYKENKNGSDFSHFNGHRLPLQPNTGSRLLDDDLAPYSEGLGDFIDQMNWAAQNQDRSRLRDVLSISRDWYYQRKYRFIRTSSKSKVKEWQEDTEFLINEGFTDFGQTNDLIREIGKYGRVFYALEGIELEQYMVETITNLPGYKQYCRHQHEIVRKCHHWARIIEPFWWPLGTTPTRHASYPEISQEGQQTFKNSQLNLERSTDFQQRLKQSLAYLIEQAVTLPKKVGERLQLLRETSKKLFGKAFSERTLKKLAYLPLWHPKFEERLESEIADIKLDSETQSLSKYSESNSEKNNIVQENIHLQTNPVEESKVQITPHHVVRSRNNQSKPAKSLLDGYSAKIDHTPPYMKGFVFGVCFFDLVVKVKPYLFCKTLAILLRLVKENLKINLEKFERSFKTSERKFKQIRQAKKKNNYFYHGLPLSSLKASSRRNDEQIILQPGMKVRITADIHSSSLVDDHRSILVYVRPRDIKTKEKYLVPLSCLLRIESNSYAKAVLPQIKDLVHSLGLTKEDYLKYLKETYGVEKTGQLWPTEIIEVVRHFQNLKEEMLNEIQLFLTPNYLFRITFNLD